MQVKPQKKGMWSLITALQMPKFCICEPDLTMNDKTVQLNIMSNKMVTSDATNIETVSITVKTKAHTQTHNHFTALWILSRTTRVSRYQKKHSPTHTYRGHQSSLIGFLHLLRSMASSLFNLHA